MAYCYVLVQLLFGGEVQWMKTACVACMSDI